MNSKSKSEVISRANERRTGISNSKGAEYAGQADAYHDDDQDVLLNFKRQGDRYEIDPIKVMGVYFGKHIDSIETFVREVTRPGLEYHERVEIADKGEGIISRLDDARNYLDLFECLLFDMRLHSEYLTPAGLRKLVDAGAMTDTEAHVIMSGNSSAPSEKMVLSAASGMTRDVIGPLSEGACFPKPPPLKDYLLPPTSCCGDPFDCGDGGCQ